MSVQTHEKEKKIILDNMHAILTNRKKMTK